jgi:hypothetical protein
VSGFSVPVCGGVWLSGSVARFAADAMGTAAFPWRSNVAKAAPMHRARNARRPDEHLLIVDI